MKFINLSGNQIAEQGGIQLAASLEDNTSLKTFNLHDNELDVEAGRCFSNTMKQNKTLRKLDISSNYIPETMIE